MSLHKSLKGAKLGGKRNILTRVERIKLLQKEGKWTVNDNVIHLPKVKVVRLKKIKVVKKTEDEPNREV